MEVRPSHAWFEAALRARREAAGGEERGLLRERLADRLGRQAAAAGGAGRVGSCSRLGVPSLMRLRTHFSSLGCTPSGFSLRFGILSAGSMFMATCGGAQCRLINTMKAQCRLIQ